MNHSEKFAVSLMSLALARNGYRSYEGVPPGVGPVADMLVVGRGERFAVQVRAVAGRSALPEQLESLRNEYQRKFDAPTYFAFLSDDETRLWVDTALLSRMRYQDDEVCIEALPEVAIPAK